MGTPIVRAAGGIVWRRRNGEVEVVLVHRPRYNDWSFAKGKHERDEDDRACAIREVEEETGLSVELGVELPTLEYLDHKGREKTVVYFSMTLEPGFVEKPFVANEEVDEIRWVSLSDAKALLTYDMDSHLLQEFSHAVPGVA